MKLNWLVRLRNKAFLVTFIPAVVALVYQILGLVGVVPEISHEQVVNAILVIVNVLVTLGIVVDPTTKGICDSKEALCYQKPKE